MMRIAVVLTCYNRREETLTCLSALMRNELPVGYSIGVYLTDDGSTDGTSDAVRNMLPTINIISGDGSAFWNGGMRMAYREALLTDADFYLWLNDDTELETFAVGKLIEVHSSLTKRSGTDRHIITGSARDKISGNLTYGGLNRKNALLRPVTFNLAPPGDIALECDTMNGNCVLIPRSVAMLVGNLDAGFVHSMGDTDYGLRAHQLGCHVWIAPGFSGWCTRNRISGTFVDGTSSLAVRFRRVFGPKGMPPRAWWLYVRRHGGLLAPFLWVWPYVKTVLVGLKPTANSQR